MSKYKELDQMILSKIGDKEIPLMKIDVREVRQEAARLAEEEGRRGFRVLDSRIQALRKSGQIKFSGKGWIRTRYEL